MDMRSVTGGQAADLAGLHGKDELAGQIAARLREVTAAVRNVAQARTTLADARVWAGPFSDHPDVRLALLQLRERANDTRGLLQAWEELFAVSPDDEVVRRHYLQRLVREGQKERALAILEALAPLDALDRAGLTVRAELLDSLRAHAEADAVYERLLDLYDHPSTQISWAKRLARRRQYEDAGRLLEPEAIAAVAREKMPAIRDEIERQRAFFARFYTPDELRGADFSILAMEQAILHYRHRQPEDQPAGQRVALVTGYLGAGGAERQLSQLAIRIHDCAKARPADAAISHVEVIVKDHNPEGKRDFFLPGLQAAGIDVFQLEAARPVAARQQILCHADLRHLLEMLPPQVHYGVVRLAPHLRDRHIDVVSLWQDGTCLFGALAALFAGVPRIHLMFRGLPPNVRIHRARPEYERLYRAMAQVPGVTFASNSKAAARAYADWLGLPLTRFAILYNSVPCPPTTGEASDIACWERFAARTADATETIGGIFRFVSDKNPLLWIHMAATYLQQRPHARFVIVGNGQLQDEARALAEKLGLKDRLLFAGTSKAVGFWYQKMDVKVLLSRFEGLPNVLVEAQHIGCPVVSTPAGGAVECFDEGVTGFCLDDALAPDLDLACASIRELVDRGRQAPDRLACDARAVASRFAGDQLLQIFTSLCRA